MLSLDLLTLVLSLVLTVVDAVPLGDVDSETDLQTRTYRGCPKTLTRMQAIIFGAGKCGSARNTL